MIGNSGQRKRIDLCNESLGQALADITEKQRLRCRVRRTMEIEIISLSLQKTDFEFDLYFPQEIFHKMVDYASRESMECSDTELEAIACINGKDTHDYSIMVPVFIMDLINPTSDFTVTDADGTHLNVPNRFETSTIWGLQLFSTFKGICRVIAGADDSGVAQGNIAGELIEQLDNDDCAISILKILSALAWIAAADTSDRFQRYNINQYSHLFCCLRDVKNPSALFYKGLPLVRCNEEQAAARLFGWAVQEVSSVDGEPLRCGSSLDELHGEVFEKITEMVRIQQEIERKTYEQRDRLRALLDGERYEIVFEQICPVTNPLLYIRAYVKRYMHAVETGSLKGARYTGMQLLAEYVDHALIYLSVIRNLVTLMIELAGSNEETSRERAKRGLYILNHLCLAYNTWRVFAFLEISPETRKKVRLTTYVHTDDNSQYRERDGLEHQYIKNQIFLDRERGKARGPIYWKAFCLKARMMFHALFMALQTLRYVYQYGVIIINKPRKRAGFLYGRRLKPLAYRLNSTNSVTIPYFLSENCQTQHLSLRLYGTDNEIQPESTYIQTGERIYDERDFLRLPSLVYGRLSRIAAWMKWEAAIRYLDTRARKSALLWKFLGKRLRLPPDFFFGRTYLSDDLQYLHLYTTKKPNERTYDHMLLEKYDNVRKIELPDGRNLTVGTESNIERILYVGVCLRRHERRWLQFICSVVTALVIVSGICVARLTDSAGSLAVAGIVVITALMSLFFAFGERSAFNEQSAKFYWAWFCSLAFLQLEFVIIYIFVSG